MSKIQHSVKKYSPEHFLLHLRRQMPNAERWLDKINCGNEVWKFLSQPQRALAAVDSFFISRVKKSFPASAPP